MWKCPYMWKDSWMWTSINAKCENWRYISNKFKFTLRRNRPCDRCSTTSFDLVPTPETIYNYLSNYVYFVFSTVNVSNRLINIVILQLYLTWKGYLQNKMHQKEIYIFFDDNSPAAKDPVPPCALVCMTQFRNVYVHVQKRAGDKYQCNERDKNSGYFQCPVAKRILTMQNDIFSIILILGS